MAAHKDQFISGGPDGEQPTSLTRDVDRLVHKLRTPLNSLSLNADLLGSVSQPKPGKEALYARALKSLQTEVARLDKIAGDFQRYVAASDPKPSEAAISDVVANAVAEVGAADGKVKVTSAPATKVLADARLIATAIAELVRNGLESSGEKTSPVTIDARVSGDKLQVDVTDPGAGIEFDPPDRVFELFMGGKQGHLGFGLTYARRIARLHGGEVSLVKTTKDGATVRLEIPAR